MEPTGSFSFQEKPSWQSLDFQCSPPGQSPECASESLLTEFRILEQNSAGKNSLRKSPVTLTALLTEFEKRASGQLTELKGKEGLVTILLKVLKKDEL